MDLRVTIAQLKPYIANPDKNLEKIKNTILNVYKEDTNLIIFPELFLHGYYSKDLIYKLAEPLNSPRIQRIVKLAREYGIYVITGFAERDLKLDVLYNSALLITPEEDIMVYRKMHLPDFSVFDEARYFKKWEGDVDLWNIAGVESGMLICYDVFFPEISRSYAYMGAKLLISISASPDFSRPLFHILARARAIENTLYFIWVNTVGTFDGVGFAGGSRVVAPLGSIIYDAPLMKEEVKTINLDIDQVRIAREKRPIMKDISWVDVELMRKKFIYKL